MLRIALFVATNIAVLAIASITLSILGVEDLLLRNGIDMNLTSMLIYCGLFGMAGSFVSLLLSKSMAKRSTGTHILDHPANETEQWLVDTVARHAEQAGIGMPDVGIFAADQPNAFATGWNKNSALVAVSTGLLQNMEAAEVEAVIGHEIGHVANNDMVTLTLIQGVVNTFVMFFARIVGHVVDRAVFRTQRGYGPGYYIAVTVAQVIFGVLASMIIAWFSRRREFSADEAGATLAGKENMIGALQALKMGRQIPDAMPESLAAFGISPGLRSGFAALFSTHPPLDIRIEALRQWRG